MACYIRVIGNLRQKDVKTSSKPSLKIQVQSSTTQRGTNDAIIQIGWHYIRPGDLYKHCLLGKMVLQVS